MNQDPVLARRLAITRAASRASFAAPSGAVQVLAIEGNSWAAARAQRLLGEGAKAPGGRGRFHSIIYLFIHSFIHSFIIYMYIYIYIYIYVILSNIILFASVLRVLKCNNCSSQYRYQDCALLSGDIEVQDSEVGDAWGLNSWDRAVLASAGG